MDVNLNLMKSSSEDEMEIMTLLTMNPSEFKPQSHQNPYTTLSFHQDQNITDPLRPLLSDQYSNKVAPANSNMEAMREMIFRMAMMQPIHIDPESVKPPKRKNVRISRDPQSVAARQRRERISEKIRILQRLVPGGTKMDTASMLDEAVHYVKFLKKQLNYLEQASVNNNNPMIIPGFPTTTMSPTIMNMDMNLNYSMKACQAVQLMGSNLQMLS